MAREATAAGTRTCCARTVLSFRGHLDARKTRTLGLYVPAFLLFSGPGDPFLGTLEQNRNYIGISRGEERFFCVCRSEQPRLKATEPRRILGRRTEGSQL